MITKKTFEEIQTAMGELSIGLVEFDADGRVNRLDATMQRLLGDDAGTVVGRTAGECAAEIRPLLSGEPRTLRVEPGDTRLYREVRAAADGGQVLVTIDLTEAERLAEENARLRRQVEELTLTDELTGLPNRRAIGQALDLHISRSRRYQNPLSVVFVHVEVAGHPSAQPDDATILAVSRFLRDRLRWVDQVGRWDDVVFLAVLPETTETDARGLVEKIAGEESAMLLPDRSPDARPRLGFGVACWSKGDDQRTLLRGALRDLGADDD